MRSVPHVEQAQEVVCGSRNYPVQSHRFSSDLKHKVQYSKMSKEDNIWEIQMFTFVVIGWGFIYLFIYFVNQGAGHLHRLPQLVKPNIQK